MTASATPTPASERELVFSTETDVSPEKLYTGWTSASLYPRWFCPKPWTVADVKLDVRPGGESRMTLCGPDGERIPHAGVYLEVVPNEKLVFTDAFGPGWEPKPEPFFTGIITFESLPGGSTRYTARALHWTKEACEKHAAMGFHDGWRRAFEQLVETVRDL